MMWRCKFVACAALAVASVTSAFTYERLDREKAMVLILDIQDGLSSLVHDWQPQIFRDNLIGHAAIAKTFDLPVVITTSVDVGPTGHLLGEITQMFPGTEIIHRPGEVNAYDNEDVRKAIAATNRSQVIVAGILTDVCVAFAAQSLREANYSVWANLEASGTNTVAVRDAANAVMRDAGVHVVSWSAIMGELMRDWRTPPGDHLLAVFDRYRAELGMIARSHKGAILNGTIVPGEELLS
ncbi:YcaC related amidohydrolase [Thozetella sp. PMI_491]|nr:YcaC related amidohydrolase [Thozetella sp. PMI_491]